MLSSHTLPGTVWGRDELKVLNPEAGLKHVSMREKWDSFFFLETFLENKWRYWSHWFMSFVYILNFHTTMRLLPSICHRFAMSRKNNNNERKADEFSSFLTVFLIAELMQSEVSFCLAHTVVFPAVTHTVLCISFSWCGLYGFFCVVIWKQPQFPFIQRH